MNPDILERPASQVEPLTTQPESFRNQTQTEAESGGATDLKQSANEALQSAKSAGSEFVSKQKEKLAARIDEYTDAVRSASQNLQADEKNPLAAPADKASQQLHRVAEYLRSKDPGDLIDDIGAFARRRPELFYGTLFVAGLAAVRFLKASSREQGGQSETRFRSRTRDREFQPDYLPLPRREPAPDLAPIGPPPALETNNPSLIP